MNKDAQNTVVASAVRELFERYWLRCRVVYFSAPCGMGKTVSANALLAGHKVCAYSALDPDGLSAPIDPDCEAVLVDDLQYLTDEANQRALCARINGNPDKRFVLLSRGPLPGYLLPYQFTDLLGAIQTRAMLFDVKTVKALLARCGANASDGEARDIHVGTGGYPLLVAALGRRMADGAPFGRRVLDEARGDMYRYMETAVYLRFAPPMRRLLLCLMPFERFNAEIAMLASGDSHIGDLLRQMLLDTSMVDSAGLDDHRFWPYFRQFLRWEAEQVLTVEERRALYSRAGLYYELHDDYARARLLCPKRRTRQSIADSHQKRRTASGPCAL